MFEAGGFPFRVQDVNTLGVDLAQGIIAPTISFKVHEKHMLGASLLIGIQRFSAYGLGNFQCFTQDGLVNPAVRPVVRQPAVQLVRHLQMV